MRLQNGSGAIDGRKGSAWALAIGLSVLTAPVASRATPTETEQCRATFYAAAARHAACQFNARAKAELKGRPADFTKCETDFTRRIQVAHYKKYAGCPKIGLTDAWLGASQRFVDGGDGTVMDRQTGLQWELKNADCPGPHCMDDGYTLSSSGSALDGTVFTAFLAALNGSAFAGHTDWRLPSEAELRTILLAPWPTCDADPCLDPTLGPVPDVSFYWSSTGTGPFMGGEEPGQRALGVGFSGLGFGGIRVDAFKTNALLVRAVRDGS